MVSARRSCTRGFILIVLFSFAFLVSCGASVQTCNADIIVTKTADINDGVCSSADCSLREAVILANTCWNETIRIPAGTYTLTRLGSNEEAAETGDLDLTSYVTIIGTNQTVIDGNLTDRVFDVRFGVVAHLSKMIIQHGRADEGGGIRNYDGALSLNEITLQDNSAVQSPYNISARGGGIYSRGQGWLEVYSSDIHGNTADYGGGIAVLGTYPECPYCMFDPGYERSERPQDVMISGSEVSQNTAEREGGGVWLGYNASATIIRFKGYGNSAGETGGGIFNDEGNLELSNADLHANTAGSDGGGIYNTADGTATSRMVSLVSNQAFDAGGGIFNLGMAHFYQSLFFRNIAAHGSGGGAFNGSGAGLLLDNTTISSNIAALGGGGILNDHGNLQLNFVTVYSNESEGINNRNGETWIRNSIIAYNLDGECAGTPVDSSGYNIDRGESCALDKPSDLSVTDPMLLPLAAGMSYRSTHALQPGSPAIDSADPVRCAETDQRGFIRPQGAGCDRGAHENKGDGGRGSISGIVWHDLCAVPEYGYPPTPPPGCADPDGDGHFTDANGILESGEPGIPGVTIRLKAGTCASRTDLMTAVTGTAGEYSFAPLAAGTYCVSVDALHDGNDLVLIPGGWSYPAWGGVLAETEIVIGESEERLDINFGWDYQFLPAWTEPETTPTPTPALPAFGKPEISTDKLYFFGPNSRSDCGPKEVRFQIGLSSTAGVANVLFFARLKEQSSGRLGAWTEGVSMTPLGNNQYEITLWAENIPDVRTFGESWLQYQFVALNKAGQALVRSEVFWNVTVLRCGYNPKQ